MGAILSQSLWKCLFPGLHYKKNWYKYLIKSSFEHYLLIEYFLPWMVPNVLYMLCCSIQSFLSTLAIKNIWPWNVKLRVAYVIWYYRAVIFCILYQKYAVKQLVTVLKIKLENIFLSINFGAPTRILMPFDPIFCILTGGLICHLRFSFTQFVSQQFSVSTSTKFPSLDESWCRHLL